jgi:hypothetical protein
MDVRTTPVSPPETRDRSVDRQAVVRVGVVHPAGGDVEELIAVPRTGSGGSTTPSASGTTERVTCTARKR